MTKLLRIVFSIISLLFILQFFLILILFNRYSASATRSFLDQSFVSSVSSEHARDIALNYSCHGIVGDVTFVGEANAPIYAVEIRYDDFHYVVYVDGETGEVLWLTRAKEGEE